LTENDASVKTFVKAEKTNLTAKLDPAPRIISPRDARYNLVLGKFIKPIEGVLYRLLNEMCGGVTVMKGMNSFQIGDAVHKAWEQFSQPVGRGLDAKRFDQHTQGPALKYEQRVYQLFYHGGDRARLAQLLKWQLKTKCAAYLPDGVVKFNMGIRASGDMNTGLGTCLIACSLVHSYFTRIGVRYRLINNGDDCVVITEREDAHHVDGLFEHCKRAGYWMVIEDPVHEIEHIEFCQSHPVLTSAGWNMVRNFPVSVSKDMVSLLPLRTTGDWERWAHDVGMCGSATNMGVPVLYELYNSLARAGRGTFGDHALLRGGGLYFASLGLSGERLEITDAARVSFWEAYGVAPNRQVLLEQYYRSHTWDLHATRHGIYSNSTEAHLLARQTHEFYNTLLQP
jgi:hypothetical protein